MQRFIRLGFAVLSHEWEWKLYCEEMGIPRIHVKLDGEEFIVEVWVRDSGHEKLKMLEICAEQGTQFFIREDHCWTGKMTYEKAVGIAARFAIVFSTMR